ncbi:MAG: DUF3386 domain-containing protein [Microcoleaceae cyanobacterium]
MTATLTAREVFRKAYEHRYTWDENFPGYRADVEIKQGDEVYTGQVRINPDLTPEVTGFDNEEVQQDVYTQMRDIITHRKRSSFDKSHGKNSFSFGETDETGATEILVEGDAMGSNYKIRGEEICLVSRVMGPMAFVINTHDSLDTGDGYVSSQYDAVFRNPKTDEVMRVLEFQDTFEKVGDYYIMTHQKVQEKKDGQAIATEYTFSNIELL